MTKEPKRNRVGRPAAKPFRAGGIVPNIGDPQPHHKARSPWGVQKVGNLQGYPNAWLMRRVHDGLLLACVAEEATGWHLSVSFRNHRGDYTRYPNWDELADARYSLCPDDIEMAMLLPRKDHYLAVHETTFHLHELPARDVPVPEVGAYDGYVLLERAGADVVRPIA